MLESSPIDVSHLKAIFTYLARGNGNKIIFLGENLKYILTPSGCGVAAKRTIGQRTVTMKLKTVPVIEKDMRSLIDLLTNETRKECCRAIRND